jgi:hypothetical protein
MESENREPHRRRLLKEEEQTGTGTLYDYEAFRSGSVFQFAIENRTFREQWGVRGVDRTKTEQLLQRECMMFAA